MIKSIKLRFGSSDTAQPLEFDPGPMTVFVGPNNSGKSVILREIAGKIRQDGARHQILDDIELYRLSGDDILRFAREQHPMFDEYSEDQEIGLVASNWLGGNDMHSTSIRVRYLRADPGANHYVQPMSRIVASARTIILDGHARLSLTDATQSGDLQGAPSSLLMALFKNNDARERIRTIIHDAFDLYFVIDPTSMQRLRVRMSPRRPASVDEEKSLDTLGIEFHGQASPIEEFSDGVKAYTGLVAAIFSGNFKIILIDETEAFLHPPLVRKLGKVLTQAAAERDANTFCSTHSSDFVMGCVQSGSPVNIVRLTYQRGAATARILSGIELQQLMRDPLLRSTGVLDALFHQGTIVCEADRDRAFYEEINERLLAINEGVRDSLFINATNKQTIRRIIAPLRRMGIPAAGIIDLDILKEGDLTKLLQAAYVPEKLVYNWGMLKKQVFDEFDKQSVDIKKQGIAGLDEPTREVANNLIASCAEYGVFILPVGEIERWLSYLAIIARKEHWLVSIFERMGSDPKDGDYVHPARGDVWDFIRQIAAWIGNPNRKGMPT
jgi:ABC-type polar amino acid transport system ATPase subunit